MATAEHQPTNSRQCGRGPGGNAELFRRRKVDADAVAKGAGGEIDGIQPVAAVDGIVSAAAFNEIVAGARGDGVVPVASENDVVAGTGNDRIGAVPTGVGRVRGGRSVLQARCDAEGRRHGVVLIRRSEAEEIIEGHIGVQLEAGDIGDRVGGMVDNRDGRLDPASRGPGMLVEYLVGEGEVARDAVEHRVGDLGAAEIDGVVAAAGLDRVVTRGHAIDVGTGTAVQGVVAGAAIEDVMAGAAREEVVAVVAEQQVVTRPTGHDVALPGAGEQGIDGGRAFGEVGDADDLIGLGHAVTVEVHRHRSDRLVAR